MHAVRRMLPLAVISATALWLPTTGTSVAASGERAVRSSFRAGQSVWVDVSVATLWTSTSAPRRIDARATSMPADIRGWLGGMTTSSRRGLVGRVETQALYGDRLLVTAVRAGWLHVVAIGQPTRRDRRGYPGWVPTRQVTTRSPQLTSMVATVTRLTSWLRTGNGGRLVEISMGTRLPVLRVTDSEVAVVTPTHALAYVASSDVVVRQSRTAALARSAAGVLSTARRFIGVPYLWGGRSGFAVDCSGFTELAYRLHGVVIPRDADDQAQAGRGASRFAPRVADLLFFRDGSTIGHVGFYVGRHQMLHAPHTGASVQVGPMGSPTLARNFV